MADTLAALRSLMSSHALPLDALVVPSEDYHQSEYVSSRDKRREFVSGFTGSAGLALITINEALLWTDGRYFLQAAQQLSDQWKLMRIREDPAVDVWMADNLPNDAAIGTDPWCVSIDTVQRWERAFAKKQQKLVQTSTNLVDEVSGYLKENGIELREYGAVSADVSLLASNQLGPCAFKETQSEVSGGTDIGSREYTTESVKTGAEDGKSIDLIWADPGSCCYALYSKLNSDRVLLKQSPLALAKALKNPIELDGLRKAHISDGAAVVQYLVWLDKQNQKQKQKGGMPILDRETLDRITADAKGFVENYYRTFEANRAELVNLYRQESVLKFEFRETSRARRLSSPNSPPFSSASSISARWAALPRPSPAARSSWPSASCG
ncbi:hypothetical protein NL676_014500 [Syzygium grande]|nr:hypothetical protein NL676_014500 [Syzygium grande]